MTSPATGLLENYNLIRVRGDWIELTGQPYKAGQSPSYRARL
jgi:hypothetical protein